MKLFRDYCHSEKVFFLFLSQICSGPIQIHSHWIQILQRQQQSKNPFSYTDKDRRKNTFKKYVFFMYLNVAYEQSYESVLL